MKLNTWSWYIKADWSGVCHAGGHCGKYMNTSLIAIVLHSFNFTENMGGSICNPVKLGPYMSYADLNQLVL